MTTQLRLLPPGLETAGSPESDPTPAQATAAPASTRVRGSRTTRRNPARRTPIRRHLDPRTRRIGRAGVAAAREALARAEGPASGSLRQAS